MKIIRNDDSKTWIFVPVERDEKLIISSIIEQIEPGSKMHCSRWEQDREDSKFYTVYFDWNSRTQTKIILTRPIYFDRLRLVLCGSAKKDKVEINNIFYTCYLGSSGLIFLNKTNVNGEKAIITTGLKCKNCGFYMINPYECEWKTCDNCASQCEHNYVYGPIHAGFTDINNGEFCNKCGLEKPKFKGDKNRSYGFIFAYTLAKIGQTPNFSRNPLNSL